jgi:hypothetical protein
MKFTFRIESRVLNNPAKFYFEIRTGSGGNEPQSSLTEENWTRGRPIKIRYKFNEKSDLYEIRFICRIECAESDDQLEIRKFQIQNAETVH